MSTLQLLLVLSGTNITLIELFYAKISDSDYHLFKILMHIIKLYFGDHLKVQARE